MRRTNLCRALESGTETHYPLDWNELLLIPDVSVIKNTRYERLAPPFAVDILNAVALRSPPIIDGEYVEPIHRQWMRDKIKAIFAVALKNDNDSLVLGALGCGAFSNPPEAVAQLFREQLLVHRGWFRKVFFAVLGAANCAVFRRVLGGQVE